MTTKMQPNTRERRVRLRGAERARYDSTSALPEESQDRPANTAGNLYPDFQPRPGDVVVAVMGMTGSGKSTFISLCTRKAVPIGHSLQAYTQQVGFYKVRWSSSVDIYLVDTPGFDDTNRSDTDVLKNIATWLTDSYQKKIRLNGLIYLHRITDPRVGGSAKRNLFMFRELCGAAALQSVTLLTTMWENAESSVAKSREVDLINTEDFWGLLVNNGALVERHDNSRENAMRLLRRFVKKERMTIQVQKEMVDERKPLDQTQAGLELGSELLQERKRSASRLAEADEMMEQAIGAKDEAAVEGWRQYKEDMQRKIDQSVQQQEELKVSMEKMHADSMAALEERIAKQQILIEQQSFRHEKRDRERREEIGRLKQQLKEAGDSLLSKKDTQQTTSMVRAPGPDRVKEHINLMLHGDSYHFMGPVWKIHNIPRNWTAKPPHDSSYEHFYFAMGTNECWYRHCRVDGECLTEYSSGLKSSYPKLHKWLDKGKAHECPVHVSLGSHGYYFIRTETGRWSCKLPEHAINDAGDLHKVSRVWLGSGRRSELNRNSRRTCYVIERDDKSWAWNLDKYYNKLEHAIKHFQKHHGGIKDIALNIATPKSYIIISNKAECRWFTGELQTQPKPHHRSRERADTDVFPQTQFREFMMRNFRITGRKIMAAQQTPSGSLGEAIKTVARITRFRVRREANFSGKGFISYL